MQCALIDIGSNSMRLTVYEVEPNSFKTLFREKFMAGLAGFVDKRNLSDEGITRAVDGLLEFRHIIELFKIKNVAVFATASLRNIDNTEQAVAEISKRTGFDIEVISGEDEALLGYRGAMRELGLDSGVFVDIGGGSTEIVTFDNHKDSNAMSLPIGSLRLYSDHVERIMPKKADLREFEKRAKAELKIFPKSTNYSTIVGVGGTARSSMKLVRRLFGLPKGTNKMTYLQLSVLCEILIKSDKNSIDLILKTEPERIHTIIPGIAILLEIAKRFNAKEIVISNYGVREGYLCHRAQKEIIHSRKTAN